VACLGILQARHVFFGANMPYLNYIPMVALFAAGVTHLLIAPEHFSHAPAHGLFFAAVGVAQVVWSGVSYRYRQYRSASLGVLGIGLSGGIIVLWLLTHLVASPFATETHPLDAAALITKAAEAVAFVALVLVHFSQVGLPQRKQTPSIGLIGALVGGVALWGVGVAITPLLPQLAEASGHQHDHGNHDHTEAVTFVRSASAYFTIVNAGSESDTLVSVSGVDVGAITLHQTTIDAQAVARMRGLEGVLLNPHVRVDFAPAGNHVMLEGLSRDLYQGDVVPLTLHFASGKAIPVEFEVSMMTPQGRLNFVVQDGFQIRNAWVRATASFDGIVTVSEGSYEWRLPQGFPLPRVPENNPMTEEKVELGRYLFYDVRLSGNGTQSCSSCHIQALAFSDGRALPVGSTGDVHPRNSMSLTNSAYSATLTWANPNLTLLERQIPIPMFGEHPVELGITGNEEVVLERLRTDAAYQALFATAYPGESDPFTFNNITLALSSFTRTLISGNAPYDQYLRGDTTAMSESAQRGMELFLSEGLECHHCHTGFNLTLSTVMANTTFDERPFFNTGLYNIGGTGAYPAGNTGLHEITNVATDMGRFRPPTLRNIALTAPYMHDGSLATLSDVIQFYMDGGRIIESGEYAGDGRANPYKSGLVPGFTLTDQEMDDLIAYLQSLTDEEFISDPRFSDPFVTDSG
jgi:cytochrome c peroxidase